MNKQYRVKEDYEDYYLTKGDIFIYSGEYKKWEDWYINGKNHLSAITIRLLEKAGIIEPYEPKPEPRYGLGDKVLMNKFDTPNTEYQKQFGRVGAITCTFPDYTYIVDYDLLWPESALTPVETKDGFPLIEGKEYLVEIVEGTGWYERLTGLQVKTIYSKIFLGSLKFITSMHNYFISVDKCKIIREL